MIRKYPLICLLTLIASTAAAESTSVKGVASVRFGWDWANVGSNQYVQILTTDPAPDYFKTSEVTSSGPLIGGFLGLEFPFGKLINVGWQMGFSYYQSMAFETKGTEYYFSSPALGDKTYSYNIQNQRIYFENKFLYGFTDRLYGYISGSAGVGLNNAYNYEEDAVANTTPAVGYFKSHSQTSFSYALGAGIEGMVTKKVSMGVGYQFSDLGKFSLGDYSFGDSTDSLNNSNMYTQEVIAQISILF